MASNMLVANAVDIAKYSFSTDSNEDFSLFRRSRSDETSFPGNVQSQTEMKTGKKEEDRSRENKQKMFFRTNQGSRTSPIQLEPSVMYSVTVEMDRGVLNPRFPPPTPTSLPLPLTSSGLPLATTSLPFEYLSLPIENKI